MTEHELGIYTENLHFREPLGIPMDAQLEFSLLGQGEYNINHLFCHPVTGRQLVLRQSTDSQMHLKDQIGYEYGALELLQSSGRTPGPVFLNSAAGILVEQYLPGCTLSYRRDLRAAAECLAAIHGVPVPDHAPLLAPEDPMGAMLEECREMTQWYLSAPDAGRDTAQLLRELLELGQKRNIRSLPMPRCIINTELNSGNFIVDDRETAFLVDWEKPILGEPAQDLGHFLAPTTTFWKTDVILTEAEKEQFLRRYHAAAGESVPFEQLRSRVREYEAINCLRGVSWCAMAWVQYQDPARPIRNASTFRKIGAYLDPAFLEQIRSRYFSR